MLVFFAIPNILQKAVNFFMKFFIFLFILESTLRLDSTRVWSLADSIRLDS